MPTVGTFVNPVCAQFAIFAVRPALGTKWGMENNLRKLREARGWTQEQAATAMGTTRNQYVKLERGLDKGGRKLHEGWIVRAAKAFAVSPSAIISTNYDALIEKLARVPDERDEPNAEFEQAAPALHQGFGIPEFEIIAGASYGGGVDDSEWNVPAGDEGSISGHMPVAMWNLPPSFVETEMGLRSGFADIIKIRGDSMDDGSARSLAANDRVFIDRRDRDPRQGGFFAVWDGEGVIVKQVEIVRGSEPPQIVCKSLNKGYDPFTLVLDGNAHIIGRVAGKITRL